MAWRFVKQPNGKLARFDDPVDDFTYYDLTKEEAIEIAMESCGRSTAEKKVQAGYDDIEPWRLNVKGDGLSRWRHSLSTIASVHGYDTLKSTLEEMGMAEHLPTPEALEATS